MVWKTPERQSPISTLDTPVKEEANRPFTMEELNLVLRKLGTRKAPGPDKLPAELLKNSPDILKLFLLSHFNECFETASAPSSWLVSEVVMLVKDSKKDTRSLDNYRPISLTNTVYKVYASMLRGRLVHHFDADIRDRQFGFRPNLSTTQPIHVTRQIIEAHERQSEPLHALFLDWSKAFDSVTFNAIEKSLHDMGVPSQFIQAIMALWHSTTIRSLQCGTPAVSPRQPLKLEASGKAAPFLLTFLVLSSPFYLRMLKTRAANNLGNAQAFFRLMAHFGIWNMRMTQSS